MIDIIFSPGVIGLASAIFAIILLVSLFAWLTEKPRRKEYRKSIKNLIRHDKF